MFNAANPIEQMPQKKTKEPQNQVQLDSYHANGPVQFGPWTSNIWRHDPRHLGFMLARYKFAAKMLSGKKCILEAGCGDGIGIPILLQEVGSVHCIDADPHVLRDAEQRCRAEAIGACSFERVDLTENGPIGCYDGALSLDVIEHIPQELEHRFMENFCASLEPHSVSIIGTPNKTAAAYASEGSRIGHINLKSADELHALMSRYFENVFLFSMNDEVVHTGFAPMAHYLIAMGASLR